MEVLTISGVLLTDCKKKEDARKVPFLTFTVGTEESDMSGKKYRNAYRCFCYNTSNPDVLKMKKDDMVLLSGTFRIVKFNGTINYDIYVKQITPIIQRQQL